MTPRASLRQCGANRPGEGGDEVAAAVVVDRAGQRLDLGRRADQRDVVAEPLHERAGDRDRALERVGRRLVADATADRGQQAVGRLHRALAGVEEQEAARCRRCTWPRRARSTSGRRARPAGRRARRRPGRRPAARAPRRRPPTDGRISGSIARGTPIASSSTSSQSSVSRLISIVRLGVGDVGQVAAGELPDQPRVHRPEQHLAGLGALAQARHACRAASAASGPEK